MSVFENVQVAVLSNQKKLHKLFSPAGNMAVERTDEILESVGLSKKKDHICGALSHGEQKVLEMAIALGNRPELLIMDEPTAGLSPEETQAAIDLINHLTSELGITILFCAFEGPARIVRLQGRGEVIERGSPDFAVAAEGFTRYHGARSVIRVALDRISDSCGFGVPRYEFLEQRSRLVEWSENRTGEQLTEYWSEKNAASIDGLPEASDTGADTGSAATDGKSGCGCVAGPGAGPGLVLMALLGALRRRGSVG